MSVSRRDLFKLGGAAAASVAVGGLMIQSGAQGAPPAQAASAPSPAVAADDPVLHLVNRITWGVTPATLNRARELGYEAFLEEQLDPATLPDPAGDEVRRRYPALQLNRNDLHRIQHENAGALMPQLAACVVEEAIYSERQLQERMIDFWVDHFNVFNPEFAADIVLYRRESIRPHALGTFRDLVLATAQAPAMLDYLDNDVSNAEDPNENYARELLELHTLGVDGGYTEDDVRAVARAFTGWTTSEATDDGFFFNPDLHDSGAKRVLGHTLPAGRGIADGLHVISILVNHPSTARFLSRKLAVRFVADDPPQELVDSTAQVWQQTDGDIKAVLRHLFRSEAFRASAGQKFRRPLDFFVGASRAVNARYAFTDVLYEQLAALNHLPFHWAPPDGYPDEASAWLNSNNLLRYWNTAMLLTHEAHSNAEQPIAVDLNAGIGNPATVGDLVDALSLRIYGATLPDSAKAPFVEFASDGGSTQTPLTPGLRARKFATLYGLLLASPTFLWR